MSTYPPFATDCRSTTIFAEFVQSYAIEVYGGVTRPLAAKKAQISAASSNSGGEALSGLRPSTEYSATVVFWEQPDTTSLATEPVT